MHEARDNVAPLSGMVAFAATFLVVYAATRNLLTAAVIALPLAVGVFHRSGRELILA